MEIYLTIGIYKILYYQILSEIAQFWDALHTTHPIPNATFMK